MKNTIADPMLPIDVVYRRWFVLSTLLPLPANARGSGGSMTADDLLVLYGDDRPYPATAKLLGQAARHFALENAGECCLYWVNECRDEDANFGVSRRPGSREQATHLLAHHEGRLAAYALARVPPLDVDEGYVAPGERVARDLEREVVCGKDALASAPAPAPDVAYVERQAVQGLAMQDSDDGRSAGKQLDQFVAKVVRYDHRNVDAFLAGFGAGPVTFALAAHLSGIGVAAAREALAPRIAEFEALSTWERANVLFGLAPLCGETITRRAKGLAALARDEERERGR
jgi:hypothetical protein